MSELSDNEIFELARQRFLEAGKISPERMEEFIKFNRELNTLSVEELFKRFTI